MCGGCGGLTVATGAVTEQAHVAKTDIHLKSPSRGACRKADSNDCDLFVAIKLT